MSNKLVSFRADEDIRLQATVICNQLGTDLQSYLRMCLARLVTENGIPFSMQVQSNKGTAAIKKAQSISELRGTDNMTLDEINAEIAKARR